MRDVIIKYLNQFDLDIRKKGDARFMDQKCTPDVVCFIADCIINTVSGDQTFSVKDIWNSPYFIKNTRAIFNKPWATDKRAQHEYDKFIQQPLRMLGYAQILEVTKKGTQNIYRVKNEDILDYIAQRERNTYNFLCCYFEKVLTDSGFWHYFLEYKKNPNKDTFNDLKKRYTRFIIGHTSINGAVEVHRIFPKILNVFAVENQIPGSEKGRISKYIFTFSDLMYNRKNWRDLNKEKNITRLQAETEEVDAVHQEAYNAYYVQKAIALIRKIQTESEVHDQWGNGEATQVHHIFSRAEFPEIAHYIENLILLTATQHNTKAHPSNKTQQINKDYQLTCLLAKADTIEKSLKRFGDKYYRKESFIYVIKVGLSEDIDIALSFADIKSRLIQIYNNAA
ncbi:MAG: hypothetical protein KBG33_07220 [Paludibacteraceae bacterium]|jgi:hypothetical protein|nr:hypothetical protein [Paludibacteraceae bacterium]